jgi:ABC-type branched-subunit amino acid transport system substrate-binding protein
MWVLCIKLSYAAVESSADGITETNMNNQPNILYNATENSPNQNKKTIIKVAVILPITGKNAVSGNRLKTALPLIEYLNGDARYNQDFADKYEFKTLLYDDGCDEQKAKNVANYIVDQKDIHFVIGHYCSSTTAIGAKIYQDNGIIQISPFSTLSSLTEMGYTHFFRLSGRNDVQAEQSGNRMKEFAKGRNIGILYGYEQYGRDLAVRVRNVLRRNNIKKIDEIDLRRQYKTKDFDTLAQELIDKNLGVIYYGGYYYDLIEILKSIDKKGKRILFFTADSAQNREFWDKAGSLASNVLFTLTLDYSRDISEREKNGLERILIQEQNKGDDDEVSVVRGRNESLAALGGVFSIKNRAFKIRIRFIRLHFEKYGFFPDLYALNLFASYQIIKNIALDESGSAGLVDAKTLDADGVDTEFNRYADAYEWADIVSGYMRDQGFDPYSDYVGFETIIGAVNFNESGEWANAEYHVYRWVNRQESRPWVAKNISEQKKYIGLQGDFIRIF